MKHRFDFIGFQFDQYVLSPNGEIESNELDLVTDQC